MKRTGLLILVMLLALQPMVYGIEADYTSIPEETAIVMDVILLASQPMVYGEEADYTSAPGKAAIVMDVSTGRVLYGKNIHESMPMASTTKIMTALLAIENTTPDHMVKIPPEAVGIEGSSIYLRANERVSMKDLLYGLMLRSGNDAATAIALEIGGSIENFANLMNQRAAELGALHTNFMNPHGLHHDQHYTTVHDLALITQAALKQPLFKEIVSTRFWVAERSEYKHFSNKNKLLTNYEGGDGVKTGYTQKAGRCLVASATRNGMQLVAITLNDHDWFNTASKLLDDSFKVFTAHGATEKDQVLGNILVSNGTKKRLNVLADQALLLPLREDEMTKLNMILDMPDTIEAPIKKGQKLGSANFYLEDQLLGSISLIAQEDVAKLTLKDKIIKFFKRN
ncbi:D-alanyl-D-alanine carboxypeptidase family protein [Alkaliphilus crotonatoxidans]